MVEEGGDPGSVDPGSVRRLYAFCLTAPRTGGVAFLIAELSYRGVFCTVSAFSSSFFGQIRAVMFCYCKNRCLTIVSYEIIIYERVW